MYIPTLQAKISPNNVTIQTNLDLAIQTNLHRDPLNLNEQPNSIANYLEKNNWKVQLLVDVLVPFWAP